LPVFRFNKASGIVRAIDKERERLNRSDDPASPTSQHYSYRKRGLYAEQLERWMSVFPREQFLIIKSEDLYTDPERVVRRTLAYLGLQPWSPATSSLSPGRVC
jgi:hypothetical protein